MEQAKESAMYISLARTKQGIVLHVKGNSILEDYMRSLGDGNTAETASFSNKWQSLDGQALRVWNANPATLNDLTLGARYTLSSVGEKLEIPNDYGNGGFNLSFLRLVGISEGNGIRFLITNTVLSNDGLIELRDRLVGYTKHFYVNYVRPMEATGEIYKTSAQEIYQ